MNCKTLCKRNTPYSELLKELYLFVFMVVQFPFKSRFFSDVEALNETPPVTFELKVREQNQIGFWNILIRPTSGASFIKIGRPSFSTSGTLSQTRTLKCQLPLQVHKLTHAITLICPEIHFFLIPHLPIIV